MNINRDYLIINDVKKSNIKLDNGSISFYITDKNTQNIFVNLVINVSNNDLIQKYANIENAEDYTLTMNIVKPSNTYKVVEGKLHDKEKAIFEFNLNKDCCDEIGTYRCELLTKCNIDNHEEITTSNKLTYKVKSSVLNDLDDIVEAPEYPLVIQLFDKLSDIEQYEEDRRANELARQLAEEQRQAKHDELLSDMTNSIQAMDNKVVEVEDRISTKEEAVDKLIVDTKADIDEYKTAKDTEINDAITAQDNKINAQNNRLDIVENKNTQQDNRLDVIEAKNVEQDNRLNAIEAIDVAQNSRLDAIEVKNQQQDDRLLDIEKVNKRQDMNLKCLFAESKNNMIDITEEGNSIYLQNSTTGYALIDEIKGNTLANCNKEPNKELILNGNINTSANNTITLTEGVDGGLVDVALEGNTLVNVSKTKDSTALPLDEELTYLYANTQYTLQFVANKTVTADITLGGTSLLAQSIVAGLNRISITTPSKLVDNKLVINGNGIEANISKVVVADTDREFGYFEGMKSAGECEELEITSANSDNSLSNTQHLTHEPLRAAENVKDRYVLIDGKWYIERNVGLIDCTQIKEWQCEEKANGIKLFNKYEILNDVKTEFPNNVSDYCKFKCNTYPTGTLASEKNGLKQVSIYNHGETVLGQLRIIEPSCNTIDEFYQYMQNNPTYVTYPKNTTYEPIDYSPFEVYSGTTHISTNSVIPTNIIVKNHGFNCLLKPSTTYTVSSNLGLNTVTTPSTLTEDCLRFMDTDTSDVTTMKDVLVLEGDWTSKADLIPANFGGIESCFEQELVTDENDANYGKYRVAAKVTGKNLIPYWEIGDIFNSTGEEYYNERVLRTGFIRLSAGKTYIFTDRGLSDKYWFVAFKYDLNKKYIGTLLMSEGKSFIAERNMLIKIKKYNPNKETTWTPQIEEGDTTTEYEPYKENNITFYINEPLRGVENSKDRIYIKDDKVVVQRNCGAREYRDGDFGTYPTDKINTVYPLEEPIYEEVEYNDVKLFIESFKNSTLSYNSNVPVTSKVHYSYSVPIVDTVAQTASITDEQDQLIIDLATQVAVLEMMTM